MLNAGVLRVRDSVGRITTLTEAQIPSPNFNGGTPASNLGELVCTFNAAPGPGAEYVGSLHYGSTQSLFVATVAAIDHYVQGGLPVDVLGALCIDISGTAPVTGFNAGLPFTAAGRVATVAGTFLNLHGFDSGFDQMGFN